LPPSLGPPHFPYTTLFRSARCLTDFAGVCALQTTLFFRALHILFVCKAVLKCPIRACEQQLLELLLIHIDAAAPAYPAGAVAKEDRKSTRLNSSHRTISYA